MASKGLEYSVQPRMDYFYDVFMVILYDIFGASIHLKCMNILQN